MSKIRRLGALPLVALLVSVAWAGATKIPSFAIEPTWPDCLTGNPIPLNMDANADGMAILNYAQGANKTIVQVIVSDFTGAPLDVFIVRMNPDVGYDIGTFTVNSRGNGHFHAEISGNVTASNVEIWQQVQPPPDCAPVLIATGQ